MLRKSLLSKYNFWSLWNDIFNWGFLVLFKFFSRYFLVVFCILLVLRKGESNIVFYLVMIFIIFFFFDILRSFFEYVECMMFFNVFIEFIFFDVNFISFIWKLRGKYCWSFVRNLVFLLDFYFWDIFWIKELRIFFVFLLLCGSRLKGFFCVDFKLDNNL